MSNYIYRVELRPCDNEPASVDLTFNRFLRAKEKFRQVLADEISRGIPSGLLTMTELSLSEETGEYAEHGTVKTVDFEDFDLEPVWRLESEIKALRGYMSDIAKVTGIDAYKPPEAYAEIIGEKLRGLKEAEFDRPVNRVWSPGRFFGPDGGAQLHLLGYKDGRKIATIKAIRSRLIKFGMGLKEAKEFVESASSDNPSIIDGISEAMANALGRELGEVAHYRVDYQGPNVLTPDEMIAAAEGL